jgi:hypothetical protein
LAAVIFQNFWTETDATARQTAMMGFNKDIALAGASLIILALVASGHVTDFGPHVGSISFFHK